MIGVASYPVQWEVAGTVTRVIGYDMQFFNTAGTFTTGYGYLAGDISNQSSNSAAIRIENQTEALTTANKFAIWSGGGKSYHAGRFGIGVTNPTAFLHLLAGTATANTAPLKFTSGTLLTTAVAGAVEFLTDKFYGTITTGAARKEFTLNDIALTSGRVPFATTNGRLLDDADLTFATDTLTVTKLSAPTSVTTPLHISTGVVRLKGYTVATLPAGTQGDTAFVSDATTPTYLGALVGGGAIVAPVFYNGTAWVSA